MIDPHSVIFVSSRPEWLYKTLWQLSPEKASQTAASLQFGAGPWKWTGLARRDDLYWALHAALVSRAEHRALFDEAFRLFFREAEALPADNP